MRDGLSIATQIWWLGMMGIIGNERIACCAEVEGMVGEVFAASPIPLQFQRKCIPNELILTHCYSWPQCQRFHLKYETNRARRNRETAIGGQFGTWHMVFTLGIGFAVTLVFLSARWATSTLTEPFWLGGKFCFWWCPSSRHTTSGESFISSIHNKLNIMTCNSAVTLKVPNAFSSAASQCCTESMPSSQLNYLNFDIQSPYLHKSYPGEWALLRFSVPHVASMKG